MRTVEYDVYRLKSSHIPEIINNQVKNGVSYGGIKLIYSKQKTFYKEIKIGRLWILIPIKKYPKKDITFLRPLKKFWNVKDNWLTPNNWGRRKNPYCNVWCELSNGNYINFEEAIKISVISRSILSRSIDKNLIANLNSRSKKFKIIQTL